MDADKIAEEALKEIGKAAAKEVWEKKSRLLPLLSRAWTFFRGRPSGGEVPTPELPRRILILGPGGTGKTTLARVLGGDINVLIDPPGYYDPSLFAESVPLLGAPGVELVIAPGQQPRLNREFDKLTADLAGGAFRGLILVVDYGYHAIESEWAREHRLYNGKKAEFVTSLLAEQRKEELDLLDKLLPTLLAVTRKLWVLVVVLKQDLWSRQQDEVVRHYRDGAWGTKMNEVVAALDPKLFFLHTAYACLHIQNYTTRGGHQTLTKNAAGYDAIRQRQSLEDLFRAFDTLREWEGKS